MGWLEAAIEVIANLDVHLNAVVSALGPWMYALVFASVFAETAFVVTPFFPGDTLVFSLGALAATPDSAVDPGALLLVGFTAAASGSLFNFYLARRYGRKLMRVIERAWLGRDKWRYARWFLRRHGGPSVVLCRFLPLTRSVVPFIAGTNGMRPLRFWGFNFVAASVWSLVFVGGGYFFGRLPWVKENFSFLIVGLILIAMAPAAIQYRRLAAWNEAETPPRRRAVRRAH